MSKKKIKARRPSVKKKEDGNELAQVDGLYQNWFLDYASYVILERAVPRIEDGLKPVQRRILHSLKEIDDGRFNKVANIIGNTMQFHPHGDAAIGDAIVNLGQKDLLIETQGNWGDVRTGDGAAAARYIEARLSKFALEVAYNPQTTEWQLSYDGRKKEPVTLPVKFPLLLAQGVDGIAVGLSTKVLPHNFCELIKASIDVLKGKKPKLYPDFPTGGIGDFSEYNAGERGGRIKVRAKIDINDKKTLVIREIPYSTTTTSLIESIVRASEKGQIKVKQVVDNTAQDVEIVIHLLPGQSPEIAMDALYAFTDCQISISPNACVVVDGKPAFLTVNDILKYNTDQTVALLKRELQILKSELMEKILFSSLERIFIENRIYRDIEECETWEEVIKTIDKGLKPHKKKFYREITTEDIVRLTEIRIKRISKYDSFKADELLKDLEKRLKETENHLKHLIEYAINYYEGLNTRYGKGRERKTLIKSFESVTAVEVIATNQKLYVNREDGFVGWGLKRDEYICDCSELDDVIAIRKDGKALVSRIQEKAFMGKDILFAGVWKKGDDRMVYNIVYSDGKSGKGFVKRCTMPGVIRDKEYDLTQGNPNSRIYYVSGNPNGEAEVVEVKLSQSSTARKKVFEFDFADLEIKGRGARGNILTKYPLRKVDLKRSGSSTLSGLELWYDDASGRLNKDGRGKRLGKFNPGDQVIAFMRNGSYKISAFDQNGRFEPDKTIAVEKFNPKKIISAVYVDGESKAWMMKRFMIETITNDKEFTFISESIGSRLVLVSTAESPEVELTVIKGKSKERSKESINLDEVIDVKGWKALGNKLSTYKIVSASLAGEDAVADAEELEVEEKVFADRDETPSKKKDTPNEVETQTHKNGQQSLFEEDKGPEKEIKERQSERRDKKIGSRPRRDSSLPTGNPLPKSYSAGDTIELDL